MNAFPLKTCLAVVVLALSGLVQAQKAGSPPTAPGLPKATVPPLPTDQNNKPSPIGIAKAYLVKVSRFAVSGSDRPGDGVTPNKPGDTVTLSMTIDTSGDGIRDIPWSFSSGANVIASGVERGVGANKSVNVSATYRLPNTEGVIRFQGTVDAQNTLREPDSERANNVSQVIDMGVRSGGQPGPATGPVAQRAPAATPARVAAIDLGRASIDAGNLKENIKGQTENSGLSTGVSKDTKGAFAGLTDGRGSTLPQGTFVEPSKVVSGANKSMTDALGGKPVITGGRSGDTFGADRVNRGTTGSVSGYVGGGKGNASESDSETIVRVMNDIANGVADMVRSVGGVPTHDVMMNLQEFVYAQQMGTDGYAATKNMTWAQRSVYWQKEAFTQQMGTDPKKTPQDNVQSSGQWKPVTRADVVAALKVVRTHIDKAGGGNDPRTDNSQGGTGTLVNRRGRDDAPARDRAFGQININEVLAINQKVNPTRQ